MKKIIKDDLYRYIGDDCNKWSQQIRFILFTPGFQYTYFFRHASTASNIISRLFWSVLLKLCSFQFGIQIPVGTKIGEGFKIGHFGTIVINPDTVIGRNFSISEGTLIGNNHGTQKEVPVIGDNVCMGANSIIIGKVKIGNHVMIAPGAFINFDVPDNSIVIGNPGKIIQRDSSPTDKFNIFKLP